MLQYELTGADPLVLRDLAEFTVRPRLAGLPDVGEVAVAGRAGPRDQRAARPGPAGRPNGVSVDQVAAGDRRRRTRRRRRAARTATTGSTPSSSRGSPTRRRRWAGSWSARAGARPVRVADLGTVSYGARGPLPDRGRQRPARRAGQRLPPAERQHAAPPGRGAGDAGLDPPAAAGRRAARVGVRPGRAGARLACGACATRC